MSRTVQYVGEKECRNIRGMIQILKPSKGTNTESCYQTIKLKQINQGEDSKQLENTEI